MLREALDEGEERTVEAVEGLVAARLAAPILDPGGHVDYSSTRHDCCSLSFLR